MIINKLCSLPPKTKIYKRDYSHFNEETLINDFRSIDWNTVLGDTNINEQFDSFYSKTNEIIDKHLPLKQMNKKEIKTLSKPWITPAIQKSIVIF